MTKSLFHLPTRSKELRGGKKAIQFLQRDVLKKDFENPYRASKKRTKNAFQWFTSKRFAFSHVLLYVVLIIWGVLLFSQKTFAINRIFVDGCVTIPKEDILQLVQEHLGEHSKFFVKRSHRFFLGTEMLEAKIRERYGLESIVFEPHWPSHSLHLAITEKEGVLAYSVNDTFFAIDKQGTVIRAYEGFEQAQELHFPIIYQYQSGDSPVIGAQVVSPGALQAILQLSSGLNQYPFLSIQSFRLKDISKREVRITEKHPEQDQDLQKKGSLNQDLDDLVTSIAQAKSVDEKLDNIKAALKQLEIEKLEEGRVKEVLENERVYSPDDEHQFQELEIVMDKGWTLKLGHRLLQDPQQVNNVLNIFATLAQQVDIAGEVSEYIDLRFDHRVYYR